MSSKSFRPTGLVFVVLLSVVAVGGWLAARPGVAGSAASTTADGQILSPAECPCAALALQRQLRTGDHVKKGQLLATLWSAELAETKSRFVAAATSLMYDDDQLALLRSAPVVDAPAIAELERRRELDLSSLHRAEAALAEFRLGDGAIQDLRRSAVDLHDARANHCRASDWAALPVRSPQDGVLTRIGANDGQLVHTGTVLFEIGHEPAVQATVH